MAKNCKAEFYKVLKSKNYKGKEPEWKHVTDLVGKWEKALDSVGVSSWDQINIADIRSVDSAFTTSEKRVSKLRSALDAVLEKHINEQTKVQHRQFIQNYRNESAITHTIARMETIAEQDGDGVSGIGMIKALRDLLTRPANNTKVGLTLEESINSTFAEYFNNLVLKRIYKFIPESSITSLFNNRQFVDDLIAEVHRPQSEVNAKKYRTDNKKAQVVAEALTDAIAQMNLRLTQLGKTSPFENGNIMPSFNWQKIKAWIKKRGDSGEHDFVQFLAKHMHDADSLEVRIGLAEKIYSSLKTTQGYVDWDAVRAVSDADGKVEQIGKRLIFKDGESWNAVNNAVGERDFMGTIIGQFRYLSKQIAITQMFGPNWLRNWGQIQQRIIEIQGVGTERIFQTKAWKRTQNTFNRLTASPKVPTEHTRIETGLLLARSWEVSTKLGSAVITALMDVPIIINVVSRMYGNSFMRNIDKVMSGFTSKDARIYAQQMNIGVDGMMGALQDRFMLFDDWHSMNTAQRNVSKVANFVMKISGLEAWTDMLRAGVTALFRSEIGGLIKQKKTWGDLDLRFKGTLERFGITEKDWATLNTRLLDDKGKFDVFAIKNRQLREAFLGWFKDAAETAIISPSLRDIEHTAWMVEQGTTTEAVVKTLMQFKQFPLSYTRKVIGRHLADTNQTKFQRFNALAQLAAMTALMGVVVVQSQQVAAGKQPYAIDSAELWSRAIIIASPLGLLTDVFMESGGENLVRLLMGDKTKWGDATRAVLGPVFSDLYTATKIVAEIGGIGGNAALREFGVISPTYNIEEKLIKNISKLTQWALRQVPGNNLWQSKALYQHLFADALMEMMDPVSYRKRQRRLIKDAAEQRIDGEAFSAYGHFLIDAKNDALQ